MQNQPELSKQIEELIEESKRVLDDYDNIGLLNKIIKSHNGIKYEILIFQDRIRFNLLTKNNNWDNSARLWGGELEFDFNIIGVKGLGQKWTDDAFDIFNERIKSIKVVWTENPLYPGGRSLGHTQFWDTFLENGDKLKSVKETTFYETMSQKQFSNIKTIVDDYNETIVILTK